MAVWEPSSTNLPALNERPISSVKWKATITEVYEKLNMLKSSSTSAGIAPVEPSMGQLWLDITAGVLKVWNGTGWVNLAYQSYAVPATRAVTTTAPLLGGGALSDDLTLSVAAATDSSVGIVQYATNAEMIAGVRTDRAVSPSGLQRLIDATSVPAASVIRALGFTRVNAAGTAYETFLPVITAGDGLIGGGDLSANRTVTLGTPSTITSDTTNSVTANSHTHAVNAEASNVAGSIVGRDASGNFSAGTITATISGNVTGNLTGNVTGNVSGSSGSCTGNAATATKLATARTISLTGDVTGSASFDGSANASITATVADYVPLASPALTGSPTAPTQTASDNSTKIATTAYVKNQVASDTVAGMVELATSAETLSGTDNERAVTSKGLDYSYATLDSNRIYDGVDLETKFAAEIAGYSDVWAWLKARITAVDYSGLHIGDYVPFVMNGNAIKAQIAGIDTYRGYGDVVIGHHIDFISRDCYPVYVQWNTTSTNNGSAANASPWMVSNIKSVLNTTWYGYLPAALQAQIIEKRLFIETRYSSYTTLTDSTSWEWNNIGKLWVPSEFEVYGSIVLGTKWYSQNGSVQYPIFSGNSEKRIKNQGDGGVPWTWWLLSVSSDSPSYCCFASHNGYVSVTCANDDGMFAPICFRIG